MLFPRLQPLHILYFVYFFQESNKQPLPSVEEIRAGLFAEDPSIQFGATQVSLDCFLID
jgi:hypothetical protein